MEVTRYLLYITLVDVGGGKSLFRVLLDKRVSTEHSIARRQLDSALMKLVERSNAFQSKTTLHPFPHLCLCLDDVKSSRSNVLDFIEGSFQKFMQMPYSYFDEVALLSRSGEKIVPMSPILITLFRQWEYLETRNEKSENFDVITNWLCDFIIRLVVIGEDADAICSLTHPREGSSGRELLETLEEDICHWTAIHEATPTR